MLRRYRRRYVVRRIRHVAARTRDLAARTRDVVARTLAIKVLNSLYDNDCCLISEVEDGSESWKEVREESEERAEVFDVDRHLQEKEEEP